MNARLIAFSQVASASVAMRWSRAYNIRISDVTPHTIQFTVLP